MKHRDDDYVGRQVLQMQLPGEREDLRYFYLVKEDNAGGRSERMNCFNEVYGASAVATPDGKGRKKKIGKC